MNSDPTQKYVKELQSKLSKQKLFITTDRLMFQDSDTIGAGFFSTIFLGQLKFSDIHASDETMQVAIKKVSSKSSHSIAFKAEFQDNCYGLREFAHDNVDQTELTDSELQT